MISFEIYGLGVWACILNVGSCILGFEFIFLVSGLRFLFFEFICWVSELILWVSGRTDGWTGKLLPQAWIAYWTTQWPLQSIWTLWQHRQVGECWAILSDLYVSMFFWKDRDQREGRSCAHPLIKTEPVKDLQND